MSLSTNESISSPESGPIIQLDHSTVDVQVRIFSSSMASRGANQPNTAPLTADLTIRLPPVQHSGSRNHSGARTQITDASASKGQQQPNRPCPAIVGGGGGATLNPGWLPTTDTGGRVNNNPTNYANRRRSPSPSVRKAPAVGHQPTNLAMGATHQQRPNNVSSARSSYHAACQHSNQSRIPVYQLSSSISSLSASRSYPQPLELLIPAVRTPHRFSYHNPAVAAMAAAAGRMGDGPLNSKHVTDYLKANRGFLEHHVLEHVDAATLERWYMRRVWREKAIKSPTVENPSEEMLSKKISMSKWKFCRHTDKRQMLETLMNSLSTQPQPGRILWELACCVASSVGADGFVLHLSHPQTGGFRVFRSCDIEADIDNGIFNLKMDQEFGGYDNDEETTGPGDNFYSLSKSENHTVASYVAKNRHTITVRDIRRPDSRFKDGSICLKEGGIHILGAPVVQNDGTLTGVIELYRRSTEHYKSSRGPFAQDDEEIVSSFLVWGGIALHYADMYHALANQRNLHQFLLTVVKSIFQDMISMDTVIAKVMTFAQKLVDADRASLFLVDHKSNELYARIFDMGDGVGDGQTPAAAQEIRFPIGTGIAGQVAVTGKVLNIPDAYLDPRFNRAVDHQTGYHTTSILCMPIFIQGQVIGVMQMVNKHHGTFSAEDEESFELFAVYCGLALHHAKLYDRIRVSEQKYRVTLEVLSYHNCCTEGEFEALQQLKCNAGVLESEESETQSVQQQVTTTVVGLDQFWFSAFSITDLEKVHNAVYMFVDLFGLNQFERDSLVRFMLTVRKNYRRVPYHNWTHGFAVANSMYVILKRAPDAFKPLEAVALFVSALCHDLDHRGKNNKFMLDTASPLASIYTTSTMEHHHFNQTVIILQQEGHNILGKLKSDEFKEVLRNIKHCILATDLALFFPNRAKLAQIVENDQFTWDNKDHRLLVQAIAMTGSDLCASSKPWDIQSETVNVIFQEFYEQGDAERKAGRTPIPMMDRTQLHLQPDSQVGFISGICIPCYGLLYRLIPETKPLLDGCQSNLERWKQLAKENENVQLNGVVESDNDGSTSAKDPKHLLTRAISLPNRSNNDLDSTE